MSKKKSFPSGHKYGKLSLAGHFFCYDGGADMKIPAEGVTLESTHRLRRNFSILHPQISLAASKLFSDQKSRVLSNQPLRCSIDWYTGGFLW